MHKLILGCGLREAHGAYDVVTRLALVHLAARLLAEEVVEHAVVGAQFGVVK